MKFNWGVGITIVIIAFMTFILSFVYKASQTNSDLYAEDYYEQEINYQQTIDAKNNAIALKKKFNFEQSEEYFIIKFPEEVSENVEGKVYFYRPENASLDKTFQIDMMKGMMAFEKSSLTKGGYLMKISWTNNNENYLVETNINIE